MSFQDPALDFGQQNQVHISIGSSNENLISTASHTILLKNKHDMNI